MATFKVPSTLAADFDSFLTADLSNQVQDVTIVHDWTNKNSTSSTIRAEIYPASTKSRFENMDNVMNIRCSLTSGLIKGDYLIRPDGSIYIVDWEIEKESNNIPSRITRCNALVTYKRYVQEVVDDQGYLVTEAGYTTLAENIPTNVYEYETSPDYRVISSLPGIAPSSLTIFSLQWNDSTKNLAINDEMVWFNETYMVIDIDYVGINIGQTAGVLKVQARRKPGGQVE